MVLKAPFKPGAVLLQVVDDGYRYQEVDTGRDDKARGK